MEISDMWAEAQEHGWSSAQGSLLDVHVQCQLLQWAPIGGRVGEDGHSVLRPQDRHEAHRRSLSAVHGLGAQPLHVDGSHLLEPPDVIILTSEATTTTPTLLWRLPKATRGPSAPPWDELAHGIFVVDSEKNPFLAPAWEEDAQRGTLRFDPTIMEPADSRAKRAHDYFSCAKDDAYVFEWDAPQTVLLIDNRRVLHGRAAVSEGDVDRRLDRLSYRTSDT